MISNKTRFFSRKKLFTGYCFDVVVDDVLWPNGKRLQRDLILHRGISVVVPLLDERHVILIRQYRYGAGKTLWEIPAGTIEKNESPLTCAKREIEEEIGYRARRWEKLTSFFASPGFSTEVIHCFLAKDLKKTKSNLENDEILEAKIVSVGEMQSMIRRREIRDAKSLVPLFYFLGQTRGNGTWKA